MAEIPDDQLQGLVAAAKLLQQLQSNPAALPHLEQSIKAINPNVETSAEISARMAKPLIDPLEAELREVKQTLQDRIAADDERRVKAEEALQEQSITRAFDSLRNNEGLTDAGVEKVKEIMVKEGIPSVEAAYALFERRNPPAKQEHSSWEPSRWNIEENAVENDVKGLFSDPDKWADDMVGQVLLEERRKNQE